MKALEPIDSSFLRRHNTQENSLTRKVTIAYRKVMTSNSLENEFEYKTNKAHQLSYDDQQGQQSGEKSVLEFFVNISLKKELHNTSEVGWVNQS